MLQRERERERASERERERRGGWMDGWMDGGREEGPILIFSLLYLMGNADGKIYITWSINRNNQSYDNDLSPQRNCRPSARSFSKT